MRPVINGLTILILGSLVLSVPIAMLDLDPVPGDLAFHIGEQLIHIPVAYSLCASTGLALLSYFLKR